MFNELLRLAVRRIDAQHGFVGFFGFGIPLLTGTLSPELQVDSRCLILHVFLHAQFGHALLGIEIRGVLTYDFLVDIEGFFGLAFLQIVFAQRQVILDCAAQQPSLSVQIAEKPVHVVPGGV